MPIYEYICPSCGVNAEITKPLSELDKEVPCTSCCSNIMQRQVSSCIGLCIPQNMKSCPSSNYFGKKARVPINIIDKDDEGNITKVTTISKDGREPELL